MGDQTIRSTGGHPFWVPGKGWTKARDLTPGVALHGASGAVPVDAVAADSVLPTYNLIVADFDRPSDQARQLALEGLAHLLADKDRASAAWECLFPVAARRAGRQQTQDRSIA